MNLLSFYKQSYYLFLKFFIKGNNSFQYNNIRSGDIFLNVNSKNYAQPPLCFYQKIITDSFISKKL